MTSTTLLSILSDDTCFAQRHNGPSLSQQQQMLATIGVSSIEQLIQQTLPAAIALPEPMALPVSQSEANMLASLKQIASKNIINKSYIGQGYYNTYTPSVILRNILENPGWYTAYTPYQPEISQGRLESLLNFQQLIMDMTGMDLANASLLDEATAAAEAMTLCLRAGKNKSMQFFIAANVHPQTIDVIKTRAQFIEVDIIIDDPDKLEQYDVFGALLQYPATNGHIEDLTDIIASAHNKKTLVTVASDLLALTLLTPPGEMGADVVIGSAQRFGVPMGFGGPHAGFMATKDQYKRTMPGRVIGVSKDAKGNRALRMAMQTREQHIRREKSDLEHLYRPSITCQYGRFLCVISWR